MELLKLWFKRCRDGVPYLLLPFFLVFVAFWIVGISVCFLVFGLIYWARLAYEKESWPTKVLLYLAASIAMYLILQEFIDASGAITIYMHDWFDAPVTASGIGIFVACLIVMPVLMFFSKIVEVHFSTSKDDG